MFFARHVVVLSLWGFLFNDDHIQNISLFDIFIRECMDPWYIRTFKYSTRRFVIKSQPCCRHECRTQLQMGKTPLQILIMNYTRKTETGQGLGILQNVEYIDGKAIDLKPVPDRKKAKVRAPRAARFRVVTLVATAANASIPMIFFSFKKHPPHTPRSNESSP